MSSELNIKNMLDAGVHFGHQIQKWNPKMKQYVYTSRGGIHIIDLQQTLNHTIKALQFVESVTAKGGSFIFVGTNRQSAPLIRAAAEKTDQFFINKRWLGGTLTNFQTIKVSIDRMKKISQMREKGDLELFSKKERASIEKEYTRLNDYLVGIKDMKKEPSALFIVGIKKENIAVLEAKRLGIPVVALVDTNCDPEPVTFPIPSNDDATRSIKYFINLVSEACLKGQEKRKEAIRNNTVVDAPSQTTSAASSAFNPFPAVKSSAKDAGPTVVKVFKHKERKLVAVGTADDVELSIELDEKKEKPPTEDIKKDK